MFVNILNIFNKQYTQMKKINKNLRLANALKEFRLKKGWNQEDVATRVGFSRSVWSFLENGIQQPKMQHIMAIKDRLGLDISEFIFEEDRDQIPNNSTGHDINFGIPDEIPKDMGEFLSYMNSVREVRKDLNTAAKLVCQLKDTEENMSVNSRKILNQVCNILVAAQLIL